MGTIISILGLLAVVLGIIAIALAIWSANASSTYPDAGWEQKNKKSKKLAFWAGFIGVIAVICFVIALIINKSIQS